MLKKTMTYTDFNGIERTEDFYFNLTKAEMMEMELSTDGGLSEMVQKIIAAKNNRVLLDTFKDLVLRAYGEKSLDGKHFIKNQEVRDRFASTQAYSDLFMLLATDADEAQKFVNGIMPADIERPAEIANMSL